MSGRWLPALALALVTAAHTPPARADARGDAEALFRVGEKAFDATQYAVAADAFEQAYAKLPLPAIAFSLAQAHRLQYFVDSEPGHLERAAALYHAYVAAQKTGGRVADAVANLAQVEPLLHDLARAGAAKPAALPAPTTTRIVVTADVPGARATIDGDAGPVPFIHEVSSGDHAVTVAATGYVTQSRTATAIPGEMFPVEVVLAPLPVMLSVAGPAGADVSVDMRHLGVAPLAGVPLVAGRHVIAISARGRVPFVRDVDPARGAMLTLAPDLHRTAQRRAALGVLAGGGVLVVATGVAGALALSADAAASRDHAALAAGNADPSVLASYNRELASRTTRVHTTEVLGGGAAAVLVTGLALYLFDHPAAEAPPTITPLVGPRTAGLVYGGRF